VVLGGVAKNAAEAKTALDLAARFAGGEKKVMSTVAITGRDQVMLRVRVAEVQRDVLKAFGIDIRPADVQGTAIGGECGTFNPFTLGTGLASGGFESAASSDRQNTKVDAVIQAMERDGLLRTLAEPTLTAVSGESAKFLAGGEFPVRTAARLKTGAHLKIEFKPFGVGLGFTPVVLSEGRISLRVSTEVSELSPENSVSVAGGTIPGLKVRRAETTLELPSGGSMVLAGLIQEKTRQDINGVPGLKDLPVLGTLFRSRDFQSQPDRARGHRHALCRRRRQREASRHAARPAQHRTGSTDHPVRSPAQGLRRRRPSPQGRLSRQRRFHRRMMGRIIMSKRYSEPWVLPAETGPCR
jgi:pilus assembly protein CpaC